MSKFIVHSSMGGDVLLETNDSIAHAGLTKKSSQIREEMKKNEISDEVAKKRAAMLIKAGLANWSKNLKVSDTNAAKTIVNSEKFLFVVESSDGDRLLTETVLNM